MRAQRRLRRQANALPGQFDQRADSCAQCIQILTCQERPAVKASKFYVFFGTLSEGDKNQLCDYLINPVETRQADMIKPETLREEFPVPSPVSVVGGFISAGEDRLRRILGEYGLAMDIDDLRFMQSYFRDTERREPTVTELRLIDTYWSDHCRHTTFGTHLEGVEIEDDDVKNAYRLYLDARREVYGADDERRPRTLMDIATIAAKVLRKRGLLKNIDISAEVNACSIHVDANVNDITEDWLLMFKNETHNHPTEIEPYGGAATCIAAPSGSLVRQAYVIRPCA
jgi:phosphoribosylformylglycinamidine synthase